MNRVTRLSIFLPMGYLWMPIATFRKEEVAQIISYIFGYFLLKQFFLHFPLNKQFKKLFVVSISRFQKQFVINVPNFKLGFDVD